MDLQVIRGHKLVESALGDTLGVGEIVDRIIEFDRRNMGAILEAAEIDFPEAKRRKGFEQNPTFVLAIKEEELIGYLEYCRSWDDLNCIYISSLQVEPRFRNSKVMVLLVEKALTLMEDEHFTAIETNVQKGNLLAVELYQKFGFVLKEKIPNSTSYIASSTREAVLKSHGIKVIKEWRNRKIHCL